MSTSTGADHKRYRGTNERALKLLLRTQSSALHYVITMALLPSISTLIQAIRRDKHGLGIIRSLHKHKETYHTYLHHNQLDPFMGMRNSPFAIVRVRVYVAPRSPDDWRPQPATPRPRAEHSLAPRLEYLTKNTPSSSKWRHWITAQGARQNIDLSDIILLVFVQPPRRVYLVLKW